jgi:hypothetical protein
MDAQPPPTALMVMAEHGINDPVWDRPVGHGAPVNLSDLDVAPGLVQRLQAWNERFEDLAKTDFCWPSPDAEATWMREGRDLAYELQNELPDVQVRYAHDGDDRPMRERRGR